MLSCGEIEYDKYYNMGLTTSFAKCVNSLPSSGAESSLRRRQIPANGIWDIVGAQNDGTSGV
jgi:hypothetical protein